MRGTVQNKVEPGEALMLVYNRFAQLMNDLERNGIKFPLVTVNTKLLNYLQPEWLKNQAIVQANIVNIQSRNSGNDGRNTRHSYVQDKTIEGNNVQNDVRNTQKILRTTSSGPAANVQCYICTGKGHYACNFPKLKVRDSKYFMDQMLLAKQDEAGVTLIDEQNDFLVVDATRMEYFKELSANICLMARIQPANINSDAGPSYGSAFLSEV
ncbi:hypothetical protein Tco_1250929 [Tanacetum coccineum]